MARGKWFLLSLVWATLSAQPAGRGAISGTVIDVASGDPVRKAVVTVTWHGTPRAWATTRTDGSGKFDFEGLPAGKYDLRAMKQGLGSAIYGSDSPRELGDVITLGDGETRGDLQLRFRRSAAISGRVVDPEGDPLAGTSVTLLRRGVNVGEGALVNANNASTNDRGEYKITGIDPGEYYLGCIPNRFSTAPATPGRDMTVPQYYGGARSSTDAAPLHLRAGDNLTGIDFHLSAEHPATITGRVTGVPPPDPPVSEPAPLNGRLPARRRGGESVGVNLTPAGETQFAWSSGAGAQAPDYRFELGENLPGRYRVEATVVAKDRTYSAVQVIDAHEGVNEIILSLIPAVEVKGHLTVEGTGRGADSFTVMLIPPGLGPRRGTHSSSVQKDGSFAIESVPPGEWLLAINPAAGVFDKSVRLGDRDFLFKHLEIPPGLDVPLNIVVSSNSATISGDVAARAGILLEPLGARHTMTQFYYSAVADDAGKFKLTGVAPGKYRIFALEKIATPSFRNPESADLLDPLGEELEVPEGGKIETHPKLIPEAKAKEILKP